MATENILVAVRMRPLISREIDKNQIHWRAEPPTAICQINTSEKPLKFNFDRVFNSKVENEEIYTEICSDIVRSVIDGFNGTIFAYGQTSSGKTYTMLGDGERNVKGIMHYAIEDLFSLIQNMPEREFLLRVSYMEIYNETVRDLLTGEDNLNLKDEYGQIKVNGLQEKLVQQPEQIWKFMKEGECRRRTGETRMNEKSSRSHAIFRMIIESCVRGVENAAVNVSQFNLVDLAGSERARNTGATGTRFKESVKINQSLMTLGQVIRQLSENESQYISYRDSKLTRILQNSLGGNSLTAIICTVTAACLDETQSTLKFAERAKHIRNKPKVNEVLTEQALLKQYANKIKKLTAELEATKEEKSQQNKNLQEKIKFLEKQFVFQMMPAVKVKNIRRETWGGALDAARFRSLEIASQKSFENRKSFSRNLGGSCNLAILEEQCEDADGDEFLNPLPSTQQFKVAKRSSNSKRNSQLLGKADVAVQAEPEALGLAPQLSQVKHEEMAKEIFSLKKELAELQEFTTLERVMSAGSCNSCSNVCKVEDNVSTKDKRMPIHSESFASDIDPSVFEEIERKNEDSIFSPSDTFKLRSNEKEEDLYQYLESTVKIMGMRKDIDFPSVASDLNNNHKITLEMFNLILQYQCLTFKGCFKSEICKKIDEVLCCLRDVFKSFSAQTTSAETVEDLIENFIDKTDCLVREIEMCSLDYDANSKNDINNQSRPFDSIADLPSFEDSPRASMYKNEVEGNSFIKNVNLSATMHKDENSEENTTSVCDCEKLKSQIVVLEKDIGEHLMSLSAVNSCNAELIEKIDALQKQIEVNLSATMQNDENSEKNTTSSACDCEKLKSQIVVLETDIEEHLKCLSSVNSCNVELKEKIDALQKRIEAYETSNSNNNGDSLISFKDQACQVAYMDGLSFSSSLNESHTFDQDVDNLNSNSYHNFNKSLNKNKIFINEQLSEEVFTQALPDLPISLSEKENCTDELKTNFEATLGDLTELKLYTLEFMKREMKKEYLVDIGSFDEPGHYPLPDQIKVEVTALKELLLRLEFYLNAQSNIEKHLFDSLERKLLEISGLEDKLSKAEAVIKTKEKEFNKLECTLSSIEDNLSEIIQKLKSLGSVQDRILYFELKDDTSFILHSNKSVNCAVNIQKLVSEMDTLINTTVLAVNDLSLKLETQDKLIVLQNRLKESKSVQTVEDIDLSQKFKEIEDSTEKLNNEIKSLQLELEVLTQAKECLQRELDEKINLYETKIKDMEIKFGLEKEEYATKRMKETEEKYYRMIMDQEKKFLEEKHQIELDFFKQISDSKQNFVGKIDQLQEENHKNIADLKTKLNVEIEERYKERMKLEDKIRSREKDITQYQKYNYYLKGKCKELAVELKKCKEKAKSFEQKENVLQENNNEKLFDCKQTQTSDNFEEKLNYSSDLCDKCKELMKKLSDFQAFHQSEMRKSEILYTKLQNELEAKKAKTVSLESNNAKMVKEIVNLKKEITAKSVMLRFCQCRGLTSKMPEVHNLEKVESTEKGKGINLNPENDKEKPSDFRNNLSPEDILQLEIVQDAIKKAILEEKERLLSSAGCEAVNSVTCYYLNAKLNKKNIELEKKNKEMNLLRRELNELKKYPLKQNFELLNEPLKDIKGVEENNFTPFTKSDNPLVEGEALHPKMQRRNILKETNRKLIAPFPTSKEGRRKEKIDHGNDENCNPFAIPISLEAVKKKKPIVPDNKDKAAETQRQIDMLFGEPGLSWE